MLEQLTRRARRHLERRNELAADPEGIPPFADWLQSVSPELNWGWPHLHYVRSQLEEITSGRCRKLAIAWPPQHYKTWSTTVRYPLWRMLREPGLRVGVGTYNQRYANKISRWTRRIVERLGVKFGDSSAVDSWTLANGSSYIARGAGVGLAGEPVDLWICDDPFKNREAADSAQIQEKVWEWHMDDVTPRIQQGGACVVIHTRWNPGDLIGRLQQSEDWQNWRYVRLPAVAESQEERDKVAERQNIPAGLPDPIGRQPGEPLCVGAFDADALADKRRVLGVGFETLYQQNDIMRGGTFFSREWFKVSPVAGDKVRRVRYWDLSSCLVAGTMVRTSTGDRPIEQIQPGEMVLTRKGFRRVKNSWLTKYVDSVTTVRFSNGASITGTADHPVWTENRGWVELGELTSEDYNTSITKEGDTCGQIAGVSLYRTQKLSSSTAYDTTAGRDGNTTRRTDGTRRESGTTPSRCTKPSGSSTAGQSHKATTFITSTATTTGTLSTIWNCLHEVNTQEGTEHSPNTPSRRKGGLSNPSVSRSFGRLLSSGLAFAPRAAANFRLDGCETRNTVRRDVVPARGIGDGIPVYDIEVEDAHEFFANGVLVHNSRKDTADFTSGVLLAKTGEKENSRYWVEDVIRGRWNPGERNAVMRQTAEGDGKRAGFERTWFESPAFDRDRAAHKAIVAALAGFPCRGDDVSGQSGGSKQVRAEPVSDAARAGLVNVVAGPWNAAFLTELEGFPRASHDDQVDSLSGAFNKINGSRVLMS